MNLPDLTDQLLNVDYVECNPVASDGAINSSPEEDEVEDEEILSSTLLAESSRFFHSSSLKMSGF
jgi:hypothetical protein